MNTLINIKNASMALMAILFIETANASDRNQPDEKQSGVESAAALKVAEDQVLANRDPLASLSELKAKRPLYVMNTLPFAVFNNLIFKLLDIRSTARLSCTCKDNFSAIENIAEWQIVKNIRHPHTDGVRLVDSTAAFQKKFGENALSISEAAGYIRFSWAAVPWRTPLDDLNTLGEHRVVICSSAARILNFQSLHNNNDWHSLHSLLNTIKQGLLRHPNPDDLCLATQIVLESFDPSERLKHSSEVLSAVLVLNNNHSATCAKALPVIALCKQHSFLTLKKELGPTIFEICGAASPLITPKMTNRDAVRLLYAAKKMPTEEFNATSPAAVGLIRHDMSIHECSLIFNALKRLKDQALAVSTLVQKTGLVNDNTNVNNICTILDLVGSFGNKREAICAEAQSRAKVGMNFILLKSLLDTISRKHISPGKN